MPLDNPVLNEGQEQAIQNVFQFLLSPRKEYRISGGAGVGKTFLMKRIMNTLLEEYQNTCKLLGFEPTLHTVAQTATTNKAAEVLAMSTGHPSATIHTFLGLTVYDDYCTGKSKIDKTKNFRILHNTLLFIDESSMIDTQLHKYILEALGETSKVIYVGDHCQLAPVFEKISPVYKDLSLDFSELSEPVRNADQPALMDLCAQLRDTVKTKVFKPIQEVPGVIDYIDDAQMKFILDSQFKTEDVAGKALCFTNERVDLYNEYIRGMRGYPSTFTKGEIVVVNSALVNERTKMNLKVEQLLKIEDVQSTVQYHTVDTYNEIGFPAYRVEVSSNYYGIPQRHSLLVPERYQDVRDIMTTYRLKKDWEHFYYMKNTFPDLRPKDGSTIYKAQGSTYDFVILDLGNIGLCSDADQTARMLYVGASRPTTRLYLYGKLPDHYHDSTGR